MDVSLLVSIVSIMASLFSAVFVGWFGIYQTKAQLRQRLAEMIFERRLEAFSTIISDLKGMEDLLVNLSATIIACSARNLPAPTEPLNELYEKMEEFSSTSSWLVLYLPKNVGDALDEFLGGVFAEMDEHFGLNVPVVQIGDSAIVSSEKVRDAISGMLAEMSQYLKSLDHEGADLKRVDRRAYVKWEKY